MYPSQQFRTSVKSRIFTHNPPTPDPRPRIFAGTFPIRASNIWAFTPQRPRISHANSLFLFLGSFLCFVLFIQIQPIQAYSFTQIDYPGAYFTAALGINNIGQIVGYYFDDSQRGPHGFVRDSSGRFTSIDYPGAYLTDACGINDTGQIVGEYEDDSGWHGFVRDSSGQFTSIDYPGAYHTATGGINGAGQMVGDYWDINGFYSHGYLRDSSGQFTSIDYPGASDVFADGINDSGQIVGWYVDASGAHGYLRDSSGQFTSIDYPSGDQTGAEGINGAGQIVGWYWQWGYSHGFVRDSSGQFTSIDHPSARDGTQVYGINDTGQIVGTYWGDSGTHGFVTSVAPLVLLTLNKTGSGTGRVTSSPSGIDCGLGCTEQSAKFGQGTPVTLTEEAGSGSTFQGWTGGGCSGKGPCEITMGSSDITVTAQFERQAAVPAFSQWGMIVLPLLLVGSGFWMIRRRRV